MRTCEFLTLVIEYLRKSEKVYEHILAQSLGGQIETFKQQPKIGVEILVTQSLSGPIYQKLC